MDSSGDAQVSKGCHRNLWSGWLTGLMQRCGIQPYSIQPYSIHPIPSSPIPSHPMLPDSIPCCPILSHAAPPYPPQLIISIPSNPIPPQPTHRIPSQVPLLRPLLVDPASLRHVTLIIAIFDYDRVGADDLLGTYHGPRGSNRCLTLCLTLVTHLATLRLGCKSRA